MVSISQVCRVDGVLRFCYAVTVLGLVGGDTARQFIGDGRVPRLSYSIPPSKQNRVGNGVPRGCDLRRRDGARRGPGGRGRLSGRARLPPSPAAATRTLAQNRAPGAGLRAVCATLVGYRARAVTITPSHIVAQRGAAFPGPTTHDKEP